MKTFDRWLGLLGGTVIMRAASVTACDLSWVGDGYCDRRNNNENCGGYDGGDCCECTCIDEAYECGIVSFSCIDPAAACVDDDDYVPWYYMYDYYYYTDDDASNPSASCLPTLAGDGLCDSTQNNAECGGCISVGHRCGEANRRHSTNNRCTYVSRSLTFASSPSYSHTRRGGGIQLLGYCICSLFPISM
ncbi:unnamed protein product [Ectocarpus sp. 8 AP-2014]